MYFVGPLKLPKWGRGAPHPGLAQGPAKSKTGPVQVPIRLKDCTLAERLQAKWTILSKIVNKGKVDAKTKDKFEKELDQIFNILHCNCPFLSCEEFHCITDECPGVHIQCSCPLASKIPLLELAYIKDQQEKVGSKGSMQMASVDKKESARQQKAIHRKQAEIKSKERREAKEKEEEELEAQKDAFASSDDDAMEAVDKDNEEDDATFSNEQVDKSLRAESHQQNRTPLPTSAKTAIRYNLTHRAAAAYGTAVLIDHKIGTQEDQRQIISKSKIERAIEKCLEEYAAIEFDENSPVVAVFFDGRTDKTRVAARGKNGKRYTSFVKEEHVTMITEPRGQYLGHFTPTGKGAEAIKEGLFNFFVENDLLEDLEYVGGDSTVTNTGYKGGVMYFLEKRLNHRLTRIVRQLHTNELPLRHIIEKIDGPTTGSNSFSGW